ncbi:MAG: RNA-binding cell elongation regulator Jag/EloR [Bacillota bacterium]|nr:RNA-binding cell elongation regulator Jag/EloR [Bacillota bacterium]
MNSIEVNGKTVEEAVEKALEILGVPKENAIVEVLEEPTKGFLGLIGQKNAIVKVTKVFSTKENVLKFLEPLYTHYQIKPEVKVEEKNGQIHVNMTGKDLGVLIGRRGDTLDALQYWLNLAINKKTDDRVKVMLDIEGYRSKREETLIRLAKKLSQKVKQTKRRVILEPMNPYERSIIHTALQDDSDVQTFSEGDEPYRKVVISLKR